MLSLKKWRGKNWWCSATHLLWLFGLILHYHLTYTTLQVLVYYELELLLNMRFGPHRYKLFDAFVSCGKVLHEGQATEEEITKRVRELLDQLPWAHRPGLTYIMRFIVVCMYDIPITYDLTLIYLWPQSVLVKLVDTMIKLLDLENSQVILPCHVERVLRWDWIQSLSMPSMKQL